MESKKGSCHDYSDLTFPKKRLKAVSGQSTALLPPPLGHLRCLHRSPKKAHSTEPWADETNSGHGFGGDCYIVFWEFRQIWL